MITSTVIYKISFSSRVKCFLDTFLLMLNVIYFLFLWLGQRNDFYQKSFTCYEYTYTTPPLIVRARHDIVKYWSWKLFPVTYKTSRAISVKEPDEEIKHIQFVEKYLIFIPVICYYIVTTKRFNTMKWIPICSSMCLVFGAKYHFLVRVEVWLCKQ